MRKHLPAMLGFMILSAASFAANAAGGPYFRPYIEGGAEFGGDTIGTLVFVGGSTQDIKAGQGLWVSGGLNFRPNVDSRFGLRAGAGYKYVTSEATNVDVHLSRFTFELMPSFQFSEDFWGSLGAVRHGSVELDAGGLAPNEKYKSSTGARVELGWRFLGLSYTDLEYTDRLGGKYKAGSYGFFLSSAFGGHCCRPAPRTPARSYTPPPAPAAAPEPPAQAPLAAAAPEAFAAATPPVATPEPIVAAAPVAVAAAEAPDLAPAGAAPLQGNRAFARSGALLRSSPSGKGAALGVLPAGVAVIRLSTLKIGSNTWWDAEVDGVGRGWITERELRAAP